MCIRDRVNRLRGINDVSLSGVHNSYFYNTGSEIGEFTPSNQGYVFTKLRFHVNAEWHRVCKPVEDNFTVYKTRGQKGTAKGRQPYLKLYCACVINSPAHARAMKRSNWIMVTSGAVLTHAICGICHKRYEERV